MNYKIEASSYFVVAAKRLAKHYPSFKKDYAQFLADLKKDPWQGVDLGNGIRKIRFYQCFPDILDTASPKSFLLD